MLNWEKRPFEIANLINPAFCAIILHASIGDFFKESNQGMPFALVFLILPMILHEPTQKALPQNIRKTLTEWFKEQPEEFGKVFMHQVRQFVPYTRESLLFGMQRSILQVDEDGSIIHGIKNIRKTSIDLLDSSRFIGRWFAQVEHESLIFKTFGICI